MFQPTEFGDEVIRRAEEKALAMVTRMEELIASDPHPDGAQERAYLSVHGETGERDLRAYRDLLLNMMARPELADELHTLNHDLDDRTLAAESRSGMLGIVIRLAVDGWWASELTDPGRFRPATRANLVETRRALIHLREFELTDGSPHSRPRLDPRE